MRLIIKITVLIILIASVLNTDAQSSPEEQKQIDSINYIIKNPKSHDTSVVNGYLQLVGILGYSNFDTILPLTNAAKKVVDHALTQKLSKAEKLSLNSQLANIYYNIGYYHQFKGEAPLSIDYFTKCYNTQIKTGEQRGQAETLNAIGYIYEDLGDIKKALDYYNQSIKICEEANNLEAAVPTLINLAMLYKNQNDVEKAIEYSQKSMDIATEIEDNYSLGIALNNLGTIYADVNDYKMALKYYTQSVQIRKKTEDYTGLGYSLSGLAICQNKMSYEEKKNGNIYLSDSLSKAALNNLYESLKIRVEIGDKSGEVHSLNYLGKYYFDLDNLLKAHTYYYKSLKLAEQLGYPKLIERIAGLLFEFEKRRGNYKEAIEMRDLQILMKDSVENETNLRAALKQQSKYEYEKEKALNDAENEKRLAVAQEAKAKQKVISFATAGGLGLVGLFLIFVINRLKVTRRQKEVIEVAHHHLEEKNKEITDSIQYAKRIQSAILPPLKVVKEYLQENFILYKPKDIVAGDFYWIEHRNSTVLFAAADCTGHGVPGAMVSVVCNNGLNRSVREHGLTDPGEILNKTREIVIAEFEKSEDEVKDGMDIALCSLKQEGESWKLKYAGANNPLWVIRNGAKEIEEIKANKQPIGKYSEPLPFTTHIIELEKGDSIYIFSDGYVDQFGGDKGKKFKAQAFRVLLLSIQTKPMEEQRLIINQTFEEWKGNLEQIDDVCVIGVRI